MLSIYREYKEQMASRKNHVERHNKKFPDFPRKMPSFRERLRLLRKVALKWTKYNFVYFCWMFHCLWTFSTKKWNRTIYDNSLRAMWRDYKYALYIRIIVSEGSMKAATSKEKLGFFPDIEKERPVEAFKVKDRVVHFDKNTGKVVKIDRDDDKEENPLSEYFD